MSLAAHVRAAALATGVDVSALREEGDLVRLGDFVLVTEPEAVFLELRRAGESYRQIDAGVLRSYVGHEARAALMLLRAHAGMAFRNYEVAKGFV